MFYGADFGYSYTTEFEKDQQVLQNMINEADHMMYQDKKAKQKGK